MLMHKVVLPGLLLVTLTGCPEPGSLNPSDWPERAGDVTVSDDATTNDSGTDGGGCVTTPQFFETSVWEPFMGTQCLACHISGGIGAQGSALTLVMVTSPEDLETNLTTVAAVAEKQRDGASVLLLKPTGQVAHGGGPLIELGSSEHDALVELVGRLREPISCDELADVGVDAARDTAESDNDTTMREDTASPDTTAEDTTAEEDVAEDLPIDMPPESQIWRFEGESEVVESTTGRAFDTGFNIWSNGDLTAFIDVPHEGDYILRARVWGSQCCGMLVQAALILDGQEVTQFEVSAANESEAETLEFRISGLMPVRHSVGVRFLNDFYDEPQNLDRNLLVDWFELEGPLP